MCIRDSLNWETAYARSFQIQVSTDNANWTSIYSTTTGAGGVQNLTVSGTGRYVRMYGTVRNTVYGYSLWELSLIHISEPTRLGMISYAVFCLKKKKKQKTNKTILK